jgi:hypothetical protein
MKLTGEYQVTDNGVIIEGRILDTHIAELRQRFSEDRNVYAAWVGQSYFGDVSFMQQAQRATFDTLGSRWFETQHNKGTINFRKITEDLGFKSTPMGVGNEFMRMGLGVDAGNGFLFYERKLRWRQDGRVKNAISKVVNCGWVFGNTQADGSFKVELYGLVNRHILSVILGKATTYAKILDHEIVLKATENKANLTPSPRWF